MKTVIAFFGVQLFLLQLFGGETGATKSADMPAVGSSGVSPIEVQLVFPGLSSQGLANSRVDPPDGSELVQLRGADGTKIVGLFGKAKSVRATGAKKATLLYFYGNGMCVADSLSVFNRLRRLGFNLMTVDYEGYGMSEGSPSETGCYAAADAAYDFLLSRDDVNPNRIVVCGWSLGAAVAIDLATRRHMAGVLTFSAFTNIPDMARVIAPDLSPAINFNSRFDNLAKTGRITCPLFMAHGTVDSLVPITMLDQLSQAAKTKATVVRVRGAGHNDIFRQGGDGLFEQVQTFVDRLPEKSAATQPR